MYCKCVIQSSTCWGHHTAGTNSQTHQGVILPLETESQGVVAEILPFELGQPFKKPLHNQ